MADSYIGHGSDDNDVRMLSSDKNGSDGKLEPLGGVVPVSATPHFLGMMK